MIRVNPNNMPDLLFALSQTLQQQNTELLELSTGRSVNTPSDNPAAAAQIVQNHDQSSQVDSYQQSMSTLSGQFQTADATISSVITELQRALTLGVQAANQGTLNDADRSAIASELQGIQTQLVSLANTTYQGKFIFSGTAQTQPFVVDATVPSGVRYAGNTGVNDVTVGNGYQLQVNLPGSQLFSASGVDMFQSMNDLINSVLTNNGIDAAVTEVRNAFDHISEQRVFYGNNMNQVNSEQTYLNTVKVQLSSQEDTIAGADIATVASNLVQTENARQAALQAIGLRPPTSLFNYLQ
jgi:flagellar hook-associated protein 3 FlgL